MAKRNLTLSIDGDLLDKARVVAARRRVSLTSMVRDHLEEIVASDTALADARRRLLKRMLRPRATVGQAKWTREELHDRNDVC